MADEATLEPSQRDATHTKLARVPGGGQRRASPVSCRQRTGSSSRYFSVMAQSQLAKRAPGLSTRKISLRGRGAETGFGWAAGAGWGRKQGVSTDGVGECSGGLRSLAARYTGARSRVQALVCRIEHTSGAGWRDLVRCQPHKRQKHDRSLRSAHGMTPLIRRAHALQAHPDNAEAGPLFAGARTRSSL